MLLLKHDVNTSKGQAMRGKALQVAKWEYIEKMKSKAFIISLFLMPIIMLGMGLVPGLLASRSDTESKVIGIVDQSGEFTGPLSTALENRYKLPNGQPNYILRPIGGVPASDLASAKREADSLVNMELVEGYLIVGSNPMTDTVVEYRSQNVGNIRVTERLSRVTNDLVVERKLQSEGLDPSKIKNLTREIDMKTIKISKSGKEEESGFGEVFIMSYVFMMMMFILIVTSGQLLVRSMLEEKSNRVVEVLMSSCSSNELMAGKIIGLSALGLTQMAFWGLIGIAVSLKFTVMAVSIPSALMMLVYFLLGYLLYAAIFVAAGSPVSTEQEAQQITSYLVMILIVPIMFAVTVIQNPNATLVKVLTFIPLLTPSMMAMRIPIQMPSAIEIALTLFLLSLSVFGAILVAGKVFRTTILFYGKRPSLRELIRLVQTK